MAPWPEQGNEPKAPDKSCNKSGENSSSEATKVSSGASEDLEVNATTNKSDDKQVEERNPDVSNLDDGQLKALLDEAITYKCPKDREGKSHLFRELLQEAEADETECGDSRRGGIASAGAGGSRYYSNSNRRRGRRDAAVSERQTRGGSLQNLVHASSSEFDTSFGYFVGGTSHSGRRKSKRSSGGAGGSGIGGGRDCGVSVSARQREGGSLPSNVNVGGIPGGGMLTLSGLEYHPPTSLQFEDVRFCGKQTSSASTKRKESFGHSSLSSNDFTSMPVHVSTDVNSSAPGEAGGRLSSTTRYFTPKSECMVIDLGNCLESDDDEAKGTPNDVGVTEKRNGAEEEGTELEVLQRAEVTTRVPNYTSRATLEVGLGDISKKISSGTAGNHETPDVDSMVTFPLGRIQCEKGSSGVVNGVEQSPLQLASTYNSVKCIMGSTTGGPRDDRITSGNGKGNDVTKRTTGAEATAKTASTGVVHNVYAMPQLSVLSLTPPHWSHMPDVNRLTFGGSKDCSGETKNKALDENGNAVNRVESSNSNSNERKGKQRKTKTNNDRNVIMSQNIEGHRGDKDIDTLIKFINSDSKGKTAKNTSSHSNGPVSFGSKQQRNSNNNVVNSGTKPRRERGGEDPSADEDRSATSGKGRSGSGKQVSKEHRGKGSKLKKSNSLEEISKTKLEDLTSSKAEGEGGIINNIGDGNSGEEGANSLSSSLLLRRPKKQTTLDDGEFFGEKTRVGDRRSWGTEEGQQYYCNDAVTASADESSSGSVPCSNRKRRGGDERRRSDREDGVTSVSLSASGASEETEFHVVTKKQRRKKRRSSSGGRGAMGGGSLSGTVPMYNSHVTTSSSYYPNREGSSYYQRKTFSGTGGGFPPHDRTVEREGVGVMLYQYRHRPRSPDHLRRKSTSSMPPSDKSDSSDLDSVHSLPVSSTTPKLTLDQTSTSSGSTPQASYADIARMASNNVVPTPPQPHYGNINLNPGRWPAMVAPKIPPPSSSSVVSTPVPSTSNPQFITGPKLNIGVPPVSGSKVTTNSPTQSGAGGHPIVPSSCSVEDSVSLLPAHKESESCHLPGTDATLPSKSRLVQQTDSRPKKDATTSTTTDYPAEEQDLNATPPVVTPNVVEKPVNILLDGEYPSLEESLVSDKSDRKPGKGSGQVHNTPFPHQSVPDSNVSASVTISVSTVILETSKGSRHQGNVVSDSDTVNELKDVKQSSSVEASVEATVVIPRRTSCVPESEATAISGGGNSDNIVSINRPKDSAGKSRSAGKKSGSSGSRPPVIIMDETEQETVFGDSVATASELTFGFEVNELLLLSDAGDETMPVMPVENENGGDIANVFVDAGCATPVQTPSTVVTSNAGEDFSARYREPTTQADNHDKIVTFVGLAWDDVLKEMNCTPVHPGSKVQYYSGQ